MDEGPKFTLNFNPEEKFYKMMNNWYMFLDLLAKNMLNKCWKCQQHEGSFCHMQWMCNKDTQIHLLKYRRF